jgi:catechol 2,3-dioxygenase-like lactoylglutathione lyase family enzyme
MILGIHHGGRTVLDLDAALAHLRTLSDWTIVHPLPPDHPLIAGLGVQRGALLEGPNAFIELLEVAAPVPNRRTVAQPGISHLSIQLPDMTTKNANLTRLGIERHAGPVELGTGFSYLYVRDLEHNVTEIEGAAHAPRHLTAWFSHAGIATSDLAALRDIYEGLLGSPAVATARFSANPALDSVTALNEVDVTMSWVPSSNARVELIQFHHPATGPPENRPVSVPGVGHLALEVDDLAADVAAAVAVGLTPLHETTFVDGMGVARLHDQDGTLVEFLAFERKDDPLSLRNVEDLTLYPRMDALLASGDGA